MDHRLLVKDTDKGKLIRSQIEELIELKERYKQGLIRKNSLLT